MTCLKLTSIICILLFFQIYGISQVKVLLYSDDKPFLLGEIENILTELKDTTGNRICSVVNLTRIEENKRDEQITDEARSALAKQKLISIDVSGDQHIKLAKELSDFHYSLKVNIHPLQDLLEYQFILYRIQDVTHGAFDTLDNSYTRVVNVLSPPARTISFFLDPRNSDYRDILSNNLKRLFPASNFEPRLKIACNGITGKNEIFIAKGDSVVLDAGLSFDKDHPKKALKFFWRQVSFNGNKNYSKECTLPFHVGESYQKLVLKQEGDYELSVQVSDGISRSKEERLLLKVRRKPISLITRSSFRIIDYASIYGYLTNKNMDDQRSKINFGVIYLNNSADSHTTIQAEWLGAISQNQIAHYSYLAREDIQIPDSSTNAIELEVDRQSDTSQWFNVQAKFRPKPRFESREYRFRLRSYLREIQGQCNEFKIKYDVIGPVGIGWNYRRSSTFRNDSFFSVEEFDNTDITSGFEFTSTNSSETRVSFGGGAQVYLNAFIFPYVHLIFGATTSNIRIAERKVYRNLTLDNLSLYTSAQYSMTARPFFGIGILAQSNRLIGEGWIGVQSFDVFGIDDPDITRFRFDYVKPTNYEEELIAIGKQKESDFYESLENRSMHFLQANYKYGYKSRFLYSKLSITFSIQLVVLLNKYGLDAQFGYGVAFGM